MLERLPAQRSPGEVGALAVGKSLRSGRRSIRLRTTRMPTPCPRAAVATSKELDLQTLASHVGPAQSSAKRTRMGRSKRRCWGLTQNIMISA